MKKTGYKCLIEHSNGHPQDVQDDKDCNTHMFTSSSSNIMVAHYFVDLELAATHIFFVFFWVSLVYHSLELITCHRIALEGRNQHIVYTINILSQETDVTRV